jgi:transcriptional regulator with XRE-family HTH domain
VPCHRIYLAQIEAGTKTPSIATGEKIAKALGVKVVRLFE